MMSNIDKISFLNSPINAYLQIDCLVVEPQDREKCLVALQSEGFYDMTSSFNMKTIKNDFQLTGSVGDDLFSDYTNRVGFIDCETASKAGVVSLLKGINHITMLQNINFFSVSENWSGVNIDSYIVEVDNFRAILWTRDEIHQARDSWLFAGDRFISFVNWMLDSRGSNERFYYEFTGNDTLIVLLTDGMYRVLREFNAVA